MHFLNSFVFYLNLLGCIVYGNLYTYNIFHTCTRTIHTHLLCARNLFTIPRYTLRVSPIRNKLKIITSTTFAVCSACMYIHTFS